MKIIISPAKKMNVDTDTASYRGLPVYIEKTRVLMEYMKSLDYARCKAIWKCNDKLAEQNYRRFQEMDLTRSLTPAILSYEGIQYQYLSPKVLEDEELEYLEEHLKILSGFYGMLRPFDGVVPYRLEMQARLGGMQVKPGGLQTGIDGEVLDSLYEYWGSTMADALFAEDEVILNLASKEYSKCISAYLKKAPQVQFVTCVFGEVISGKVVEKGTLAKMARGEMVRFLAKQQAVDLETVKHFQGLGYGFCKERSDERTYIFLKGNE